MVGAKQTLSEPLFQEAARCGGKSFALLSFVGGFGFAMLLCSVLFSGGIAKQPLTVEEPTIAMYAQPMRVSQPAGLVARPVGRFFGPVATHEPIITSALTRPAAFAGSTVGFQHKHNSFGMARHFEKLSTITRAERVPVNSPQDELKRQTGYKAVDDYVKSGTVIGLGTGSTAAFAVERVGDKLASGELKDIKAIPTSIRTKEQAEALGIPLTSLDVDSDIDVAIDGADDVDPDLNLVKGGGGALFREKIVEIPAKKFIVIVDESKLSNGIGPGFPIPVEIVPFSHEHTMRVIAALPALKGCKPVLRLGNVANNKPDGDKPAVTDNGNYIVDLIFETPIENVPAAAEQLKNTVGVVDHGLFIGMTTACIIAGKDGVTVKTSR